MVDKYPHTADVTLYENPVKASNGDYTSTGGSTVSTFQCRCEPAGDIGYIRGAGGTKIDFSWLVYCPKGTAVLPVGATIVIKDENGQQLCSDKVKQFSKGQFNSRIWL